MSCQILRIFYRVTTKRHLTERPMGRGSKANLLIRVPPEGGLVPQLSCVNMLRAQTPRLVRANHRGCGDPTRHLVDFSLPKQRPRRVCDPQPTSMWSRVHGIELIWYVPRFNPIFGHATLTFSCSLAEVQVDHITQPPPPCPPPSRPIYLHRKDLFSFSVPALSLVPWSHHGPCR